MIRHLRDSLAYRLKWARLGIYYIRHPRIRSFLVAGRRVPLSFPESERAIHEHEYGRIVFDDCYRLASFKQPVRIVVDIGANIGLFALAARLRFPSADIHCYEPNPAVLPHLRFHCAAIGARLHETAVGQNQGTVSLEVSTNSLYTLTKASEEGAIHQESFGSVMASIGHVDLLKLDCEGAEWELFQCEDVWQRVDSLTMEYHLWAKPHLTTEFLLLQLSNLGFSQVELEPSPNGPWGFAFASRSAVPFRNARGHAGSTRI